jgi:histidine ammonia-lyase
MWDPTKKTWSNSASDVLKSHGLEPITLTAKEGLALINGTQFISGLGAEALKRAKTISIVADIAGAMTLEALKGTTKAYSTLIHNARPHNGQLLSAARLRYGVIICCQYSLFRNLLDYEKYPSEISKSHENCGQVQDSYTLRCMPQVHGIGIDTIKFVEGLVDFEISILIVIQGILTTEINSATDNPMVFAEENVIISGGNFHGEYPAKACDYLAIGVHEFGNISEVSFNIDFN